MGWSGIVGYGRIDRYKVSREGMPEVMRGGFFTCSICTWRGEKRKGVDCRSLFRQITDAGFCRWRMCSRFPLPKQLWPAFAWDLQGSCVPGNCWFLSSSGGNVMQELMN